MPLLQDLQRIRDERANALWYISEQQTRHQHWATWHREIREDDAMIRGDFHVVFPDESAVLEKPKVPNRMWLALLDYSAAASSVLFSHRCDAANERGQSRAKKRERIIAAYRERNRVFEMLPYYYMDLIITGANIKLVLPDFESGFPCIERRDPRHTYPDRLYRPDKPPKNCLFSYQLPMGVIAEDYPDAAGPLGELVSRGKPSSNQRRNELVEVLEWYDSTEWIKVAAVKTSSSKEGITLARHTSLISRPPVVISAHPSFDGNFRGFLHQTIGPLSTENRIANLGIDAAVDWIYSQLQYYDIANPEDIGTGRPLRRMSPNGFMGRVPPGSASPAHFNLLASLQDTSREQSIHPRARSGDIQQNIASAAFVQSVQGGMSTELALLQRTEAASWAQTYSLCLETDEKYLETGERKYIAGSVDAQRFSETYLPSKDISGDYQVRTEFSGAAGGDEFSYEVRLYQAMDRQIVPRRIAMERSSYIDDVSQAEKLLLRQQLTDAAVAFIGASATNRDFMPAAEVLSALEEEGDDADPLLILSDFVRTRGTPAPTQGTGMEAAQQAGQMMRGLQGQAGPENVPGMGALPAGVPTLEEMGIVPGGA